MSTPEGPHGPSKEPTAIPVRSLLVRPPSERWIDAHDDIFDRAWLLYVSPDGPTDALRAARFLDACDVLVAAGRVEALREAAEAIESLDWKPGIFRGHETVFRADALAAVRALVSPATPQDDSRDFPDCQPDCTCETQCGDCCGCHGRCLAVSPATEEQE